MKLLAVFLVLLGSPGLWAQEASLTPPDTARSDTLLTDEISAEDSGLEGPVKYWAESIYFSVPNQTTTLLGNVKIEYQNITLTAGKVVIEWDKNRLIAEGVPDSTDSLGNVIYKDLPVLTEKGNEPIRGQRLEYNFKNQRGKILVARTKMEPGYYQGQLIKKVGKKTLLIRDGYFTTCELSDHPHFYFKSQKMRVIVNKRAVAKPIVLYIADVPIAAVPFGVFPLERGRRSGFILPKYGESRFGGRYLRQFGFYWAASDYWDATLLADFYERTGMAFQGELRYKKRYSFDGNVNGVFMPRDIATGRPLRRWRISFAHSQRLGQTATLSGRGTFVSDRTFQQQYSPDIRQRLNQSLTTNINFRKSWPTSKNSLSASLTRVQNLQTGQIDYEFPNVVFSMPSRSLFPVRKGARRRWYNEIRYSYRTNLKSKGVIPGEESVGVQRSVKSAWVHTGNISFSSRVLRYFSVQQSARFQELWVPEYLEYRWVDSLNAAVPDTVKAFRARHTFSFNMGARTKIYGIWNIPLSPLRVIRHTMEPSVSFSLSPDFTNPAYGYVQVFRDSTGRVIKKDRFAGNLFGGTTGSAVRNVNISVNNLFQGKWIRHKEEKKIDLFRVSLRTSYNFLRDSLKWSDINASLNSLLSRRLKINASATYSLYQAGADGRRTVDRYVWEGKGFALPRLLRWNVSVSTEFQLRPPEDKDEKKKDVAPDTAGVIGGVPLGGGPLVTDITRDPELEALARFKLPWQLNVRLDYRYSWSAPRFLNRSLDAQIEARVQLTRNWRVNYNAQVDFINKTLSYQRFAIYRDLHCWEMSFSWQPTFGFYQLEIRVKASALRDLKITKTAGGRAVF
ncbi:MAG: LPS-assembly protein LptD [Calditrichaeota bacterium]|nr:LPS-assembly protein LptD [Calditrichota bacterium]